MQKNRALLLQQKRTRPRKQPIPDYLKPQISGTSISLVARTKPVRDTSSNQERHHARRSGQVFENSSVALEPDTPAESMQKDSGSPAGSTLRRVSSPQLNHRRNVLGGDVDANQSLHHKPDLATERAGNEEVVYGFFKAAAQSTAIRERPSFFLQHILGEDFSVIDSPNEGADIRRNDRTPNDLEGEVTVRKVASLDQLRIIRVGAEPIILLELPNNFRGTCSKTRE
ncbi:unnamed protein product [Linum trigynum]|uniref:Uncharacterized protein n=1 Tax=Linum trigynum TaxID=586398 RepID=A0AAV2FXR3_9ROSI